MHVCILSYMYVTDGDNGLLQYGNGGETQQNYH